MLMNNLRYLKLFANIKGMYEGNTTMYVYFSKFQIPQHFLLPVAPITCSTFSNKIFESFSKAITAFYIHTLLNEQQHTSSVENISTNQPFQYTHDTHTTLHAHYPPLVLGCWCSRQATTSQGGRCGWTLGNSVAWTFPHRPTPGVYLWVWHTRVRRVPIPLRRFFCPSRTEWYWYRIRPLLVQRIFLCWRWYCPWMEMVNESVARVLDFNEDDIIIVIIIY